MENCQSEGISAIAFEGHCRDPHDAILNEDGMDPLPEALHEAVRALDAGFDPYLRSAKGTRMTSDYWGVSTNGARRSSIFFICAFSIGVSSHKSEVNTLIPVAWPATIELLRPSSHAGVLTKTLTE